MIEGVVLGRIKGAIVLIGAAAVFGLIAARPFFPHDWRELAGALATLVLAVTFGLILLINKLVCGTCFPGRKNRAQPVGPKPRSERHDLFPVLFWTACLTGCGLLTVYVLNHYNLRRRELYLGALIAPLILLALVNGLRYLCGRS